MAPPNFSHHKKRKSRSRGTSARRISRNKSKTNFTSDEGNPLRSSSCDQTSQPSTSAETNVNYNKIIPKSDFLNGQPANGKCIKKSDKSSIPKQLDNHESNSPTHNKVKKASDKSCGTNSNNKFQLNTEGPSLLSLANVVAEAAIVTASSALSVNTKVDLKKESILGVPSTTIKMVSEEDTLDNLCELLDRLDAQYGSNCASSSKVTPKPILNQKKSSAVDDKSNCAVKNMCTAIDKSQNQNVASPKNEIIPKGLPKAGLSNNDIANGPAKEDTLTPEEKQALRKARKEGKKQNKLTKTEPPETATKKENLHTVSPLPIKSELVHEKSKADLKRERREKQEAQRASKLLDNEKNKGSIKDSDKVAEKLPAKKTVIRKKEIVSSLLQVKRLPLLGHLTPLIEEVDLALIHPAIRIAGLSMKDRTVDGCNARVFSALSAISALIEDYSTPLSCDLSRDLSDTLAPNIIYLNSCRPIHEPMNNALRFVKREINNVDQTIPELQAKEQLLSSIKNYIDQNIILASKTICQKASKIIENGDVILTFGYSSLVVETIKEAATKLKSISVIVVDKPVPASGVNMLPALAELGIKLYYRIIPDITIIMSSVTKIMIEAEGLVLNGAVLGACGTAGLALEASIRSIPFVVLSQTYKFCNIDLTDSLVVNELGDSDDIMNNSNAKYKETFSNWRDYPTLNIVNLVYDVTPAELVGVLVTERHIVPTTVVPTIIKKNFADVLGHD